MDQNQENSQSIHAVHIARLIHKAKEKEFLTAEEQDELLEWRKDQHHEAAFSKLNDREAFVAELKRMGDYDTMKAIDVIFDRVGLKSPSIKRQRLLMRRVSIAAAVLLAIASAWLFVVRKEKKEQAISISSLNMDIPPASGNKTLLTLSDGTIIVLDSSGGKMLPVQSGTALVLDNNRLMYRPASQTGNTVTYNLLQVPRGRQFQVMLPDGSNVWLNAASSIRYPTAFTGKERLVEITGEAYFEVAHDLTKPFIVKNGDMETKVLGTHFNINTYEGERSRNITLLEGAVQVKNDNREVVIRPGQQAQVSDDIRVIEHVDVDEVIAWKEGKFQFGETADIQSIMRQVANWYDVDVKFNGTVRNHIGGTISRNVNLSLLLKMLETTGVVTFKVEGRMIEVIPQQPAS